MGLFANFVDRVMKKKIDDLSARAEQAGAKGVEVARSIVPVRTGRLQRSINFYWNRATLELTLSATEPYAAAVARRSPYMQAGRAAMSKIFTGGTSSIQFDTVPEQHQAAARAATKGQGIVIGHRKRVKFRR